MNLKLFDNGNLDNGYLLFYTLLIGGVITPAIWSLALILVCVLTYRDEVLRIKDNELQKLKAQIEAIESELTQIKLHEGIKTLK